MRVGADIGAVCRKCGDVWHVVVALVDRRIARVECKQCGGRHRYRPAEGGDAVSGAARGAGDLRRATAARAKKGQPLVTADPHRSPRPYRASEAYELGDRVQHPSFGEGVVQSARPKKVLVLFAGGEKTLVHDRGRAS